MGMRIVGRTARSAIETFLAVSNAFEVADHRQAKKARRFNFEMKL
jgi:hypothetical protein